MDERSRLAVRAGVFLVVLTLVFFLVNSLYYAQVLSPSWRGKQDIQFDQNKETTRILFMGDSQIEAGLNPFLMPGSFNFGSATENYPQTYYKLKKILEDPDVKLEVVLLQADLHSFSSSGLHSFSDEWYWKKYVDFEDLSNDLEQISPLRERVKAEVPFAGKGIYWIQTLLKDEHEMVLGQIQFFENFSTYENKTRYAEDAAKMTFKDVNALDPIQLAYFEKIVELAKENNITIILVKTPVHTLFHTASLNYVNESVVDESINELVRKHTLGAPLDYRSAFLDNESLFTDGRHLNYEASIIFTEMVRKDVQERINQKKEGKVKRN